MHPSYGILFWLIAAVVQVIADVMSIINLYTNVPELFLVPPPPPAPKIAL